MRNGGQLLDQNKEQNLLYNRVRSVVDRFEESYERNGSLKATPELSLCPSCVTNEAD